MKTYNILGIDEFKTNIGSNSRLLGIDPGKKRVGIAISDENKIIATPYTTIVKNKNGGVDVVIGYSSTNTNRVSIPVETETNNVDKAVTFNANLFKEVLVSNRECSSAILEVSTEGLAKVNFKIDDFDSTYYIVAMQDVD